MTNISARTWVLTGFAISLVAVLINVFVMSNLSGKIKETDDELGKLTASLSNQAKEITNAEIKYDLFTVLSHISKLERGAAKESSGEDAVIMLQEYLSRHYVAVNDIPANEYLKSVNEEMTEQLLIAEKVKASDAMRGQGKTAESDAMLEIARKEYVEWRPKTELGKKLYELENAIDAEKLADKDTRDAVLAIIPVIKSSNEQYIANYQKKETRIKQLQERKSNLSGWQNVFTYLAVSLQLFGLMFVMTKDLVEDTKKRREKAEKELQQAEEEIRLAEIEAESAKKRARQANADADEAEARAEERIEEALATADAAENDAAN